MDKILVIEDNADVRDNIAEILELAGYTVYQASNGKEGVALAQTENPDIILCDIMMPELDGYGVLYLLSKNEKTASIPFIFLTAKADKADIRKGMNEGADDYITKPYEEYELLQAVETRLKRSRKLNDTTVSAKERLTNIIDAASDIASLRGLTREQRVETFRKKEPIYREGNNPYFVYFIDSGRVKSYKTNEDGKELIIQLLGPGDFFGYEAVIKDEPYNHNTAVLEDVSCTIIPKKEFIELLSANSEITASLVKLLTQRLSEGSQELMNLAYNSVRKRVALGLLRMAENCPGGLEGELFSAGREDIANLVGTATESVIRVMTEFKEDGLIEISGRQVKLVYPQKLKDLPY